MNSETYLEDVDVSVGIVFNINRQPHPTPTLTQPTHERTSAHFFPAQRITLLSIKGINGC